MFEGGSTHFARGAVLHYIPTERGAGALWYLAREMSHELGHQVLMVYQAADALIASDLATPLYSGVRRRDRPAIQVMHAAAALAYMIVFQTGALAHSRLNGEVAPQLEFQRLGKLVADLRATLMPLLSTCSFTAVGDAIMGDFGRILNWGDECLADFDA